MSRRLWYVFDRTFPFMPRTSMSSSQCNEVVPARHRKEENGERKATTEIENAQAKNLIRFVRTFGMVGPDSILS